MNTTPTWKATWLLIRAAPWPFLLYTVLWTFYLSSWLIFGLITQAIFDELTGAAPASIGLWGLVALLVGVESARIAANLSKRFGEETFRYTAQALLRKNIVANVLASPGALGLPVPPGDALSRLRGDVAELADFPTWLPHVLGYLIMAVAGVTIMFSIHPLITLVAVLPSLAVAAVGYLAWKRILRYWDASRAATGAVTGFLGEILDAVQAVKVSNAEGNVLAHFQALNQTRRKADLKSHLFQELINWISYNLGDLGFGVVLLLAGQAMQPGPDGVSDFTVGDFALFSMYLSDIVHIPGTLGSFIADYQTQTVSIRRMLELQPHAPPETLLARGPTYVRGDLPPVPHPAKTAAHRLEKLEATGLSYNYPGSENGIQDVNLRLERGSFTVITGRVGSGKSTLLRVLLGLLPADAGEIRWNGQLVQDSAIFFVPPRSAYTAQVPLLFSASLRDNILMGLSEDAVNLPSAIRAAVLEQDVSELQAGLETIVGPRGVKLSGGQVQRAAAARMFARDPELLVLDDLSSALDVETERALWERLFTRPNPGTTCLAVSHRRPALRRADHVIVLQEGKVEAEGKLDELLETCPGMQRLWRGER